MGVFGSDDEENGISGSWISLMKMCVNGLILGVNQWGA